MKPRTATVQRDTNETRIQLELCLDGAGTTDVKTGLGFLDHMLSTLAHHAGFDLKLHCDGDLHVDDHHTAEDCALALGSGIDEALGDRAGIARFGDAHAPLDEALSRAVIDLSGRPHHSVTLGLERESIGGLATENLDHVLCSLAVAARATLHVDVLRGQNDHHRVESAFKATALALRRAVVRTGGGTVPSTKGVL